MPRKTENTGEGRGSGHKGLAKGFAFGVASVTEAPYGTSFPISKQDLIREHGKEEVRWTRDSSERLGDILKDIETDAFLSVADVASAVSETHRNEGEDQRSPFFLPAGGGRREPSDFHKRPRLRRRAAGGKTRSFTSPKRLTPIRVGD